MKFIQFVRNLVPGWSQSLSVQETLCEARLIFTSRLTLSSAPQQANKPPGPSTMNVNIFYGGDWRMSSIFMIHFFRWGMSVPSPWVTSTESGREILWAPAETGTTLLWSTVPDISRTGRRKASPWTGTPRTRCTPALVVAWWP